MLNKYFGKGGVLTTEGHFLKTERYNPRAWYKQPGIAVKTKRVVDTGQPTINVFAECPNGNWWEMASIPEGTMPKWKKSMIKEHSAKCGCGEQIVCSQYEPQTQEQKG
jgi:hypothetical protein